MIRTAALAAAALLIAPYVAPAPRIVIPPDLLAASDQIRPQPDYRFTSDGCSGGMSLGWRLLTGRPLPFEHCCVAHDGRYWAGGTAEGRAQADAQLEGCVAASGHPVIGAIMRVGVRPGGTPYLPTAWRWGYGWHWPRGYQ